MDLSAHSLCPILIPFSIGPKWSSSTSERVNLCLDSFWASYCPQNKVQMHECSLNKTKQNLKIKKKSGTFVSHAFCTSNSDLHLAFPQNAFGMKLSSHSTFYSSFRAQVRYHFLQEAFSDSPRVLQCLFQLLLYQIMYVCLLVFFPSHANSLKEGHIATMFPASITVF